MSETIRLGEIAIAVTRKAVKHVHLSVHPPNGRVTLVAPAGTRLEVARAYAVSKLAWIRDQQARLRAQARETPRRFVTRESHYVWGKRYLLRIIEADAASQVELKHNKMILQLRPGSGSEKRQAVVDAWYREQLKATAPAFVAKWEKLLGVSMGKLFVQKMKTRWGSCSPGPGNIRLNTELAKKPVPCLEYIVAHELAHLPERHHNERFVALMDAHMPQWRQYREILNSLPLAHQAWGY